MGLYDGDCLEFPALGFVHGEQLNTVIGPRENAQILDGQCVPPSRPRMSATICAADSCNAAAEEDNISASTRTLEKRAAVTTIQSIA